MDFLDEIAPCVRQAIAEGHYVVQERHFGQLSLKEMLEGRPFSLIPVIEHRSPVEQSLFEGDVGLLAQQMAKAGAGALSVVCERTAFGGSMADLALAKAQNLPVLYKDFVIDPVQIEAAKKSGADAVLLIKSLFDKKLTSMSLKEAIEHCHQRNLETLLEVFTLEEFEASQETESDMIGINNRNLKTLTVDLSVTTSILAQCKPDRPVIGESGVKIRAHMTQMQETGAKGALVGTAILRASDPAAKIREMLGVAG